MTQSLFERLSVLFEYTCVANADDLLQVAKDARQNKSKMPNGELFITKDDCINKKTIQQFLLYYGK